MLTAAQLDHLETHSYTVVPGYLPPATCARQRAFMDTLFPPPAPRTDATAKRLQTARHPIAGDPALLAETLQDERAWAIARQLIGTDDLFVLEQVLIRTDPGSPDKRGPSGWHMDFTFTPEEYHGRPRQTYFHMVHCLSTVAPGGAAFTIVPGSHRLTLAALAKCADDAELVAARKWPAERFGVDLSQAREVLAQEGDLLIFNPLAFHSASANTTDAARFVLFLSFAATSAWRLIRHLRDQQYQRTFSDDFKRQLPPALAARLELPPTPAR